MINQLIKHRQKLLLISIGIVYLWFGTLKLFPGLSPAEELAKATLDKITFGLVPTNITYFILALWEIIIGVCMLLNFRRKDVLVLTMVHLVFTFTPLFLLPEASFNQHFSSLTLIGQYIIKNLVFLAALLFLMEEKKTNNP